MNIKKLILKMSELEDIGVVNGIFSADNLPIEWKESLKQTGVRKKDLNNKTLRIFLFKILIENKKNDQIIHK